MIEAQESYLTDTRLRGSAPSFLEDGTTAPATSNCVPNQYSPTGKIISFVKVGKFASKERSRTIPSFLGLIPIDNEINTKEDRKDAEFDYLEVLPAAVAVVAAVVVLEPSISPQLRFVSVSFDLP